MRNQKDLNELYEDKGLSGIDNMGNTCYLNSALQCLSNCRWLTYYILSNNYLDDMNQDKKEFKFLKEYCRFLVYLWEDNCVIEPVKLKKVLEQFNDRYLGWRQHDSHEVFNLILDLLHNSLSFSAKIEAEGKSKNKTDDLQIRSIESWKSYFSKEYSIPLMLFYGQYHTKITCLTCNKNWDVFEPFCSLNLTITKETDTLKDCLDLYTKEEELDKDNLLKCEHCNDQRKVKKQSLLWRMPSYLIIIFKRFNFRMAKITKKIDFPLIGLNMSEYMESYDKKNCIYDLVSICNHSGNTSGGHYFSYCKNSNGNWYEFNDDDVNEIENLDNLVSSSAYYIIYERRNLDENIIKI
jgi:ubiquitin carboxyl-terminal hydrolase 2